MFPIGELIFIEARKNCFDFEVIHYIPSFNTHSTFWLGSGSKVKLYCASHEDKWCKQKYTDSYFRDYTEVRNLLLKPKVLLPRKDIPVPFV